MRIAVNLLFVRPGKIGGSEVFVTNLIRSLLIRDSTNEYLFILSPYNQKEFSFANAERLIFDKVDHSPARRVFVEQCLLPNELRKKEVDALLALGNTGILHCPCKLILTLQDFLCFAYPCEYTWAKKIYLQNMIRASIRRADRILAVSQNTKNDAVKYAGADERKITVIYEGVDFNRFSNVDKNESREIVRREFGLCREFIYAPLSLFPRKNIDLLIEYFKVLKKERAIPHKLLISGVDPLKRKVWLEAMIKNSDLTNEVIYLGTVADSLIPHLYKAAGLVVYLSSYEGFGLPILEAMAAGCPVLSSNLTSLPEVAGDAAVLVDPFQKEDVISNIFNLLNDLSLREDYIKKGIKRARDFSWDRPAENIIKVFNQL